MIRLKVSTASQEVPLGPFVDATDGFTLEDALGPIAASDIKLWKNGASSMVNASGTATFMVDGTYVVTLDATDTNTIGPLVIVVTPSGARPLRVECEVLPAIVFDSLGTELGIGADIKAVIGEVAIATKLGTLANTVAVTVVGGTSTTTSVVVSSLLTTPPEIFTVVDQMRGKVLRFTTNSSNTDGITCAEARIAASTTPVSNLVTLTVEPPLPVAPQPGDICTIIDGQLAEITATRKVKASVEELQGSAQAAQNLTRMGLASASGTLASGCTTTVLQISTITPTPTTSEQFRRRVVLFVDESGTPAAVKIQGGRIAASTTTALTLEEPLTQAPAAGTVFIIV